MDLNVSYDREITNREQWDIINTLPESIGVCRACEHAYNEIRFGFGRPDIHNTFICTHHWMGWWYLEIEWTFEEEQYISYFYHEPNMVLP